MRRDNEPLDMQAIPKVPSSPCREQFSFAVKTCINKDRYCRMVHTVVAEGKHGFDGARDIVQAPVRYAQFEL